MRVLVTGASGCVGLAVSRALLGAGYDVVAAQRSPSGPPGLQVAVVRYDAAAARVPDRLFDGVDALVHLAATAHVVPRTAAEIERMRAVNVDGAARVAAAAVTAGTTRLIYASSVAVYGSGRTTGDEPRPDTPYGRAKLEGEQAFRDAGGTILRLSLVFGEGDRGNVAVLGRQVRRWGGAVLGDGENRKSMVHAPHIGERIVRLLGQPRETARGTFDVVDYSPTQRALLDALARAQGKRPPPRLPLLPFRVAGSTLDAVRRLGGRAPRWRRRVEKLIESTVFSGAELDRLLGYVPPRTLEEALVETFGGRR